MDVEIKRKNIKYDFITPKRRPFKIETTELEDLPIVRAEKTKTDLSDISETIVSAAAISSLSALTNETLEFSSIKNKDLLKNFEKLRFKKIAKTV